MKACPDKHFIVGMSSDNFCSECGKPLITLPEIRCACGNLLVTVEKFCSQCGRETRLAS